MQKGLSTYLFLEETLTLERLEAVYACGFDRLEIFGLKPHFDYQDTAVLRALGSWLTDKGPFLHSIHTPFSTDYQALKQGESLSIAELQKTKREKTIDEIRRALELSEVAPFPYAIVHMGASGDHYSPSHLDAIYYSLETLVPFASARGVKLLLENIPNDLSLVEKMSHFLNETHFEQVGLCLDMGHSYLQADLFAEIQAGGSRILSTHFHDNAGKKDDHLFPGEGLIPWKQVLKSFEEIHYQGCLMLELRSQGEDPLQELIKASRVFDHFTQLQEELDLQKAREE